MAQGLQCWDANGILTLDTNDSLTKVVSTVTTQAGAAGSLAVPEFVGGTRIFVVKQVAPGQLGGEAINWTNRTRTEVTVSGRTISWSAGSASIQFTYGVY